MLSSKSTAHINNMCHKCKYFNPSSRVCYKLTVIENRPITVDTHETLLEECVKKGMYEPSLKTMLGYGAEGIHPAKN